MRKSDDFAFFHELPRKSGVQDSIARSGAPRANGCFKNAGCFVTKKEAIQVIISDFVRKTRLFVDNCISTTDKSMFSIKQAAQRPIKTA